LKVEGVKIKKDAICNLKNVFSLLLVLAGSLALCLKDDFYNLKKRIFFTALFWLVVWLCISRTICRA
jgi:hypothetical protein